MPKVSIITPVYNSESYLKETIESVISQTYTDWELILVDDCSSDNSSQICKSYSGVDPRIKYIPLKENSGPAKARNIGIDEASGEYLAFLDSDDKLKVNFLTTLVDIATKNDTDVVWCHYEEVSSNGNSNIVKNNVPKNIILDSKQAVELFFKKEAGIGSLCNKLYRKLLIDSLNLRLNTDRHRAEDWEFNIFLFQQINRLMAIEDVLYSYMRINSGSVMASFREKDFPLMCRSIALQQELIRKYYLPYKDDFFGKEYGAFFMDYIKRLIEHKKNPVSDIQNIINTPEYQLVSNNLNQSELPVTYKTIHSLLKKKLIKPTVLFVKVLSLKDRILS